MVRTRLLFAVQAEERRTRERPTECGRHGSVAALDMQSSLPAVAVNRKAGAVPADYSTGPFLVRYILPIHTYQPCRTSYIQYMLNHPALSCSEVSMSPNSSELSVTSVLPDSLATLFLPLGDLSRFISVSLCPWPLPLPLPCKNSIRPGSCSIRAKRSTEDAQRRRQNRPRLDAVVGQLRDGHTFCIASACAALKVLEWLEGLGEVGRWGAGTGTAAAAVRCE
jgi:hypothetical protein